MKKIMLVLVVFTTTAIVSKAQVKFGVKAGLNGYTLGGDEVDGEDIKTKIGFNAGGLVNIPISQMFAFQPEVIYNGEGGRQTDGDDRVNYNLNYINIPLLVQFTSASGFYAEVGPQIGFLMSAKADTKIGGTSSDTEIKDQLKTANFSAAIGAGFRMSSGLGIGARYNVGLGSIAEDSNSDLKTRGFQVGLSYLFRGNGGKATK